MRTAQRTSEPKSLLDNARRWTTLLVKHINESSINETKPLDRYFNQYNKADVKAALAQTYQDCCCYCESNLPLEPTTAFGNIEHRKPKKKFPDLTFDWNNLHWGCPVCNVFKGNKYDEVSPILDAVADDIGSHLAYLFKPNARGVLRKPLTRRGETTIKHAKLNREGLILSRTEVLYEVLETIQEIREAQNDWEARVARKELERMTKGQYGSVIQWAIDTYLGK